MPLSCGLHMHANSSDTLPAMLCVRELHALNAPHNQNATHQHGYASSIASQAKAMDRPLTNSCMTSAIQCRQCSWKVLPSVQSDSAAFRVSGKCQGPSCRKVKVGEAKTALQHLKRVAKHRRAEVEKEAAHIDEVKQDLQAPRWARMAALLPYDGAACTHKRAACAQAAGADDVSGC